MYYSLIHPHLNYCNLIWAPAILCHLFILQTKKFQRVDYAHFTYYFFKQLKILKVHQINHFHAGILMYKLDYHMSPLLFDHLFSKTSYNMHSSQNYKPVFAKSNIKCHSILCLRPRIYAEIPLVVTNQPNVYINIYFIIHISSIKNVSPFSICHLFNPSGHILELIVVLLDI